MTIATAAPTTGLPLLRTLVPGLRGLGKSVTAFLDRKASLPLSALTRSTLESVRDDLVRKADDLDYDSPFLVVMLMGGTGVGKSTLLNALAGAPVALAAFTRPTTRDPVVYHHHGLKPDRLDPALRACRLVAHDREELRDKVIVDTPDLDSNEEDNRDRLMGVMPVADVVLYVGSQEKYHDRLGWEIFRSQRQRRAFAFVLNKWDRCVQPTHGGLSPDQDLLLDLSREGFVDPLLFRTAAQLWIDRAAKGAEVTLPPGEQFQELVNWLEAGLNRLEIESLKARGVGQLLDDLTRTLEVARPNDIAQGVAATVPAWKSLVNTEATEFTEAILHALDPRQREIEYHFRLTGQQRFQHLMAGYLGLITRLQYAGNRLMNPAGAIAGAMNSTPRSFDIDGLSRESMTTAGKRGLEPRIQAFGNRLLVSAAQHGMPSELLAPRLEELSSLDWRGRFQAALADSLSTVERSWTHPTGLNRLFRGGLVLLANYLPEFTFVGSVLVLLWNIFMVKDFHPTLASVLVPFVMTFAVLLVFHVLIHLFLPLRWPAIRGDFQRHLQKEVRARLAETYLTEPAAVAAEVAAERKTIDQIANQANELNALVKSRRRTAGIDALYGKSASN